MARRIIHDTDYMNFVMTPPPQEEFMRNDIKVDKIRVLDRNKCDEGLGQVPMVSSDNSWVMPVVVIVVSAMALMTLYAVLSKR